MPHPGMVVAIVVIVLVIIVRGRVAVLSFLKHLRYSIDRALQKG